MPKPTSENPMSAKMAVCESTTTIKPIKATIVRARATGTSPYLDIQESAMKRPKVCIDSIAGRAMAACQLSALKPSRR